MMKRNGRFRVCTYCGKEKDYNEEICECGKGVGYSNDWNGGYLWNELNCIDNILEDKYKNNRRG